MSKPSWYSAKAAVKGVASISILGDIGAWGVSADAFRQSLEGLGAPREIRISINSDGGDVYTGFAIFNMLDRHPARKIVTVEGLAASMGSVVAMVGDERIMPANSTLMIHNPVGSISGQSQEIIKFGESVAKMRTNIARAYFDAAAPNLSMAEVLKMMDEQTWIDAESAVQMGLATKMEEPVKIAAYFDVSKYRNAPKSYGAKAQRTNQGVRAMSKKPAAENEFEGEDLTPEQIRAQERTSILNEQKQVAALCRIAGKPELAAAFNEKGLDQAAVVTELDKLATEDADKNKTNGKGKGTAAHGQRPAARAAGDGGTELNARNNGMSGEDATVTALDPSKIYARWNRKPTRAA